MLVLTRKTDEQILIGNDIKITLIRVRGNSVRIGIDAPREVRVVRGELKSFDNAIDDGDSLSGDDRERVFAHPQPAPATRTSRRNKKKTQTSRLERATSDPIVQATTPQTLAGRVRPSSGEVKLTRAPLAGFVSAS